MDEAKKSTRGKPESKGARIKAPASKRNTIREKERKKERWFK